MQKWSAYQTLQYQGRMQDLKLGVAQMDLKIWKAGLGVGVGVGASGMYCINILFKIQ